MIKRRLTFHPRGYEHSLYFENPTHVLAIEIPLECRPLADKSTALPATLYDLVWSAMLKVADEQPAEAVERALRALFEAAQSFLAGAPAPWLMNVIDHLHKHWREVQSVNAIATRFGVSPQHLCRAFKQKLGVTVGHYSLALRTDYARGLLWGSDLPIAEVAVETGFFDQAHLTRVLGSRSERTPGRLRETSPHRGLNDSARLIEGG
jgi:transcriptional regulator GlxA family with amidase domain